MKASTYRLLLAVMLLAISHICVVADDREQQVKKTYIIHMDKSKCRQVLRMTISSGMTHL
ncbi:subtilisin-like protease SBT1.7 [Prunus yedoensis var. nudiflora]|uniref:Subtilisin-like protease SBT1.7 n=1 Tax=Prunus yedoensis var. nudiflora TaxID=2094558 RepID=A0A314XHP0_PRUYE|nr:subtilisin-like protease SBT1.7 [Prunus yedoensis var. nudiflora]